MTDPKDDDKDASAELKEGLTQLFAAARKVVKSAEPHVGKNFEDAERLIGKIGRGGEVFASEVGREVATFATRLADRLKAAADREDEEDPHKKP
jgi:hypothetical protein